MNCGIGIIHKTFIWDLYKVLKNKNFQKIGSDLLDFTAIGERVSSLSPNRLNSPEGIWCYSLKIKYQHLKYFLSVVSYRSGRASLQDFDSKRHTLRKPRPTERIMILPSSHSPSVIEPSQAMRAAAREPRSSWMLMESNAWPFKCSRDPRGIEDKYRKPDSSNVGLFCCIQKHRVRSQESQLLVLKSAVQRNCPIVRH